MNEATSRPPEVFAVRELPRKVQAGHIARFVFLEMYAGVINILCNVKCPQHMCMFGSHPQPSIHGSNDQVSIVKDTVKDRHVHASEKHRVYVLNGFSIYTFNFNVCHEFRVPGIANATVRLT